MIEFDDGLGTDPGLGAVLDHWARIAPDRIAVADARSQMTYAELKRAAARCAAAMQREGVGPGDRVSVLAPQRTEVLVSFFAAARIGAVWLGLNPKYQLPELSYNVADAGPKLLISIGSDGERDYRTDICGLRTHAPITRVIGLDDDAPHDISFADWIGDETTDFPDDAGDRFSGHAVMLVYTSGSSGRPKGVLLRQRELVFRSRVQNRNFPAAPYPKLLNPLPINHIGGMHFLGLYTLVGGGTLNLSARFSADEFIAAIQGGRINVINTLPTMYQMITDHPGFDASLLDELEVVVYSGGSLPLELVEMLMAARCRAGVTYGSSESCGSVTYARKGEASLDVMLNCIGAPMPAGTVRVCRADGNPCDAGETGEIQVEQTYCMEGYLGKPAATDTAFTRDGWLRTGDLALLREDGYLEFVGRLSEMFKSGGYNVYPREIELAFNEHPEVEDCAVVGIEDTRFGEVGWMWVKPVAGAAPDVGALREWAADRLANYKIPKRIILVDDIPLLPIGKVDKMRLRRSAQQQQHPAGT